METIHQDAAKPEPSAKRPGFVGKTLCVALLGRGTGDVVQGMIRNAGGNRPGISLVFTA